MCQGVNNVSLSLLYRLYSIYYGGCVWKALVGTMPWGLTIYVPDLFTGGVSDSEMLKRSNVFGRNYFSVVLNCPVLSIAVYIIYCFFHFVYSLCLFVKKEIFPKEQ